MSTELKNTTKTAIGYESMLATALSKQQKRELLEKSQIFESLTFKQIRALIWWEWFKYGEIKNVNERRFNNKLQTAFKTFIKDFIAQNGYIKTDASFQFEKLQSIFNEEMYASKPSV